MCHLYRAMGKLPKAGIFTISLDLELYWGIRDHRSLESYKQNLLGKREAIPAMLELFANYGIHATWAAVGFTFFDSKQELLAGLPKLLPEYENRDLNPYPYIESIGANETQDPFHFAASLLRKIKACPNQEIATHTFSHYYCLEAGQTAESFRSDLEAAIAVAKKSKINIKSLVFPRNQFNDSYLRVCHELGIDAYRGNPMSWAYEARSANRESPFRRLFRLADAYLNLSGHQGHLLHELATKTPFDIRASRFLRPFSPRLRWIEKWRIKRILDDMTSAAKNGHLYHLWWHPHNFGTHQKENLAVLKKILIHFSELKQRHNMLSLGMEEVAIMLLEISKE
jgi:peptidoglycan/xylan/chitin deacetylase (PgdA/CDA1 family)